MTASTESKSSTQPTRRDFIGLNAANFFLAESSGVMLPFMSDFLKQKNWQYSQIGVTMAFAGLGMLLFQVPAGVLSDKVHKRRILLGLASLILGVCYAVQPYVVKHVFAVNSLLFTGGMMEAFFVPVLAALALSLVGHKAFDSTMGVNQSWNHAGNIAAGLFTLIMVKLMGIQAVFYVIWALSICAASSLSLINRKHLNSDLSKPKEDADDHPVKAAKAPTRKKGLVKSMLGQFRDRRTVILVLSIIMFHIANAPAMATVALYIHHLKGSDDLVAWCIIIGQACMVPVAFMAAKFCSSRGRKPVMAVAFIVLAVRIACYPLVTNPNMILAVQVLNGIDWGIYGVVIALICGDLTDGKEGFNTLLSIMQFTLAFGGVVGPLIQGFLTQSLGFTVTFFSFSAVAAVGAVFFIVMMPETQKKKDQKAAG